MVKIQTKMKITWLFNLNLNFLNLQIVVLFVWRRSKDKIVEKMKCTSQVQTNKLCARLNKYKIYFQCARARLPYLTPYFSRILFYFSNNILWTITIAPNVHLSFPFFLCSSDLNTILLVPNKAITHLKMIFLFFGRIMGVDCGGWPTRPNAICPELELFWY